MHESGPFVRGGGLISYGPPPAYLWKRVADYVDRIRKAPKPLTCPSSRPASTSWC